MAEAKTFEEFTNRWLEEARMADSTKSMRKSIIDRDIMPAFRSRLLAEIGPEDLRNLCAKVKERGAPATAVHVRDIVKQVFSFAALHGDKAPNPADEVGPSSIATFVAKDRALSPSEIRVMHRVLDTTATLPTIRLALRLVLLTLVRKSELIEATWNEIDFENAVWTIPKSRMKAGKPHNVYLSQQALDIMVALRTCAGGSRFLLPSRYDADRCMSKATLNRVTQVVVEKAKESRCRWSPVHRARPAPDGLHHPERTGLQQRLDREVPGPRGRAVIARCLQQGRVRRAAAPHAAGVGGHDRRLGGGESHTPTLLPPTMKVVTTTAPI
jgi:integrase